MSQKTMNNNPVGLVLSGGGAKGAYHVGVMRALNEMQIPVDMISGASIGALNGAVLASAPNINTGIQRLQKLWTILPNVQPIKFQPSVATNPILTKIPSPSLKKIIYFSLLISAGLRLSSPMGALGTILGKRFLESAELQNILSDQVLKDMMEEFLDLDTLQKSIPLYVSVFQQDSNSRAFTDFLYAIRDTTKLSIFGIENQRSTFRHIQSLDLDSQKELILASAALPLLFKAHKDDGGNRFTDGGQGGMIKSQGNTPITPLIEAGCRHIIVVHLSEGSLWHRHDFPNTEIIEIRPSIPMGGFKEMLDFSESTVNRLKNIGYQDAVRSLQRVQSSLSGVHTLRRSTNELNEALSNTTSTQQLENAMDKLRSLKIN